MGNSRTSEAGEGPGDDDVEDDNEMNVVVSAEDDNKERGRRWMKTRPRRTGRSMGSLQALSLKQMTLTRDRNRRRDRKNCETGGNIFILLSLARQTLTVGYIILSLSPLNAVLHISIHFYHELSL